MKELLISCDDHLDLNQLPADLWTSRLPEHLRDRAPHIEERDGRAVWVCEGEVWGGWSGKAPATTGPKPIFTALDRGGIVDQTERRPAVPALRLADMDRDGVYAHVIFGPVTSINVQDEEFRDACYVVYNDWLAEFCANDPDRLIGAIPRPLRAIVIDDRAEICSAVLACYIEPECRTSGRPSGKPRSRSYCYRDDRAVNHQSKGERREQPGERSG